MEETVSTSEKTQEVEEDYHREPAGYSDRYGD